MEILLGILNTSLQRHESGYSPGLLAFWRKQKKANLGQVFASRVFSKL